AEPAAAAGARPRLRDRDPARRSRGAAERRRAGRQGDRLGARPRVGPGRAEHGLIAGGAHAVTVDEVGRRGGSRARAEEWRALAPGARADGLCELAARAGFPTGDWPSQRSPWLPLPATPAALDEGLTAKHRANLRRRRRALAEAHGELALERVAAGGRAIDR